jgi:hypothetical protein
MSDESWVNQMPPIAIPYNVLTDNENSFHLASLKNGAGQSGRRPLEKNSPVAIVSLSLSLSLSLIPTSLFSHVTEYLKVEIIDGRTKKKKRKEEEGTAYAELPNILFMKT